MEQQTNRKKIKLSLVTAKYIWPMWIDPIQAKKNQFAQMIMQKMLKK
jgi:hypothetical protein